MEELDWYETQTPGVGLVQGQAVADLNTIQDIDAFKRYAEQIAEVPIKTTALSRLFLLFQLIRKPDT